MTLVIRRVSVAEGGFAGAGARERNREMKDFPFKVSEVHRRMPIFVWIADRRHAAFAIPTYLSRDASVEHAFSTRDEGLVEALERIVLQY
jgi:hypothetical protein